MKANRVVATIIAMLCLMCAGVITAQETHGPPGPVDRHAGLTKGRSLTTGTVAALSEDRSSFVIGDVTAVLDDRSVLRDAQGELMSRKSLREGTRVTVRFEPMRGTRIRVKELQVQR